jgi:hypothetical protein
MSAWHGTLLGVGLAFLLSGSIRLASASSTEDERRKEIDAFNNNMVERRPQALIRWADSSKGVIRSAAKDLNGKLRQAPQVAAQVLDLAK